MHAERNSCRPTAATYSSTALVSAEAAKENACSRENFKSARVSDCVAPIFYYPSQDRKRTGRNDPRHNCFPHCAADLQTSVFVRLTNKSLPARNSARRKGVVSNFAADGSAGNSSSAGELRDVVMAAAQSICADPYFLPLEDSMTWADDMTAFCHDIVWRVIGGERCRVEPCLKCVWPSRG